jgi:hypothetical protein
VPSLPPGPESARKQGEQTGGPEEIWLLPENLLRWFVEDENRSGFRDLARRHAGNVSSHIFLRADRRRFVRLDFAGYFRHNRIRSIPNEPFPEPTPAPPELVEKAETLVREFFVSCFWFWHPEASVRYREDLPLVVEHLRDYGDKKAWKAAQDLQRCL